MFLARRVSPQQQFQPPPRFIRLPLAGGQRSFRTGQVCPRQTHIQRHLFGIDPPVQLLFQNPEVDAAGGNVLFRELNLGPGLRQGEGGFHRRPRQGQLGGIQILLRCLGPCRRGAALVSQASPEVQLPTDVCAHFKAVAPHARADESLSGGTLVAPPAKVHTHLRPEFRPCGLGLSPRLSDSVGRRLQVMIAFQRQPHQTLEVGIIEISQPSGGT